MLRKRVEQQARQDLILEATRRLLATRSPDTINMEEIADAAEYSRRSLYRYFRNRDEIYLLVLVRDLTRRYEAQRAAVAEERTGRDKIMAWARTLFAYSRSHPQSLHLQIYWDYRGIDRGKYPDLIFAEFESINETLAQQLRTIFDLGIADGTLRSDLQVDLCISQFLYSVRSVIHRALSSTYSFQSFDPDAYVRHFLDLFVRSIRSEPERDHE